MDLKWWPIAATGSAGFVAVVALAALLPMTAARRRLRPLANVARLTRLPEYAKVARLRSLSTIVTLVVLTVMFGAATWAAARPTVASNDFDAAHPEDIMLCVGQPVTDASTAELLDYFARQAATSPQTQRIGLTSVNRRLVPLTRDHQYAAARFGEYAGAQTAQSAQSASFAPPVPYTDYAASVNDVLALCLSGFPTDEQRTTQRRSIIYLGPSDLRAADEQRAALFTDGSVRNLAERAGAQVNVIDTTPSPASGSLVALSDQTGGRHFASGSKSVTTALNEIRAHAPPARRADGTVVTADFQDDPVVPLAIALLSAALLSVALLVLRR
ncbi:hypothetical protein [Mycobacterium sp. 852002-40037_SCH5390672]|uniref:hypothetical protein n=1 Tax=Mycobacterium sp. 852002-40037_SCH5390672 TaxID=1834089 RepID=UPI00080523FD|nr:hypothetical protein [Mycobacterium sp. 852002-40037_SCH5390672]OBB97412.1 hypothetical protein A5782_02555 [Mycobacterium sp. 852002-40037_SCH5390672]